MHASRYNCSHAVADRSFECCATQKDVSYGQIPVVGPLCDHNLVVCELEIKHDYGSHGLAEYQDTLNLWIDLVTNVAENTAKIDCILSETYGNLGFV